MTPQHAKRRITLKTVNLPLPVDQIFIDISWPVLSPYFKSNVRRLFKEPSVRVNAWNSSLNKGYGNRSRWIKKGESFFAPLCVLCVAREEGYWPIFSPENEL